MFSTLLLFGIGDVIKKWTIYAMVIATIVIFCYFFIKSKGFRKICGYLLVVVLIMTALFSAYHLNSYYNTKGGIIGKLTEIFNPNIVSIEKKEQDIRFDFSSVMLTQIDEEKYRAEFITDDKIELNTGETYAVYVNDTPCEIIEYTEDKNSDSISSDYVIAEYYHAFYDEYKEFILKDKLTFRFAFYNNQTRLIVETSGGSLAVEQWNSYFQKEDFVVKITIEDNVYISKYATLTIKNAEDTLSTIKVKKGTIYVLPATYDLENYRFLGWSLDGVNATDLTKIIVSEDTTLYGIFAKETLIYFYYNDNQIDVNSNYYNSYSAKYIKGETLNLYMPSETYLRTGYKFIGWSLDGVNLVDLSSITFDSDFEYIAERKNCIFAMWEAADLMLNIDLDGGSIVIGDKTYTDKFELSLSMNDTITLTVPSKTGYIFDKWSVNFAGFNEVYTAGTKLIYDANISMTGYEFLELFNNGSGSDPDAPGAISSSVGLASEGFVFELTATYFVDDDYVPNWDDYTLLTKMRTYIYTYSEPNNCTEYLMDIYYEYTAVDPVNMSAYDMAIVIFEVSNITGEITNTMTAREIVEVMYYHYSSLEAEVV